MLSKQDAALRLGMAVREVISVDPVDGGHVVITHDGYPTLITDEGELVFGADAIGERLAPAVEEPALDDEEPPVVDEFSAEVLAAATEADFAEVPTGTADEVLAWVTDDRVRAVLALAAERGREKPRSGLTDKLEKLVAAV